MNHFLKQRGQMLVQILVLAALATMMVSGLARWAATSIKASRQTLNRELAIQIAEAGIDYYRWHLAHAASDYQDGTGHAGPYTHNFLNKDGAVIGQFILNITPPPIGSTVVTIKSTGKVAADASIARSIQTQLAKSSFAKYAVVANADMRFGAGTEVFGPIHSNGGIHFDGIAHNVVTSALATYKDADYTDAKEYAVYTRVAPADPFPPTALPAQAAIFQAGRQMSIPAVDFAGITADLSQMKADAQANGFYRSASGGSGYQITLKNNDTFDLYKVTGIASSPNGCTNSETGWGTWSVLNKNLIGTFPFPTNGLIFLEDHVYVEGQIKTARLTIAAATFPDNASTRKNIIINNNLLYTTYDGQDVLALIAQGNVNVGLNSLNTLRIDAALVAQNGRVGRHYYAAACGANYVRSALTLWGMIATNQRYGFAYTDGTGYTTRNLNYDANLLYGPPPSFPLTSDQYTILSWAEVH